LANGGISLSTPLPNGTVGVPYTYHLLAVGGAPAWSFVSGILPAGVNVDASGVVSGTPNAGSAGTYGFTLAAASGGATVTFTGTLQISNMTISSPSPLPEA